MKMGPIRPFLVPDFSPAAMMRAGEGHTAAARLDVAHEILEAAIAAQPLFMPTLNAMGNCLKGMGEHDGALDYYHRALALAPQSPEIYMNVGSALIDVGRLQDAANYTATAMALDPNLHEAAWNLAITVMTTGNLHEGWRLAARRWATAKFRAWNPNYPLPLWEGQEDAHVLVWGEQGLGERIMFLPMIADLAAKVAKVTVECERRLLPLFQRTYPQVDFVSEGTFQPGTITHQIPLGDLGQYFRDTAEAFPQDFAGARGYLQADPNLTREVRSYFQRTGKRVIGLSWRSSNTEYGGHKSMSLFELAPIIELPNVICVNLQYGDTSAEREAARMVDGLDILNIDKIDLKENLDGVAAIMKACDMVVSVSNTHAHMAAALGVPTCILLPRHNARFWYWFINRSDSPWYPSARLYRQEQHGNWGPLVTGIAGEIAEAMAADALKVAGDSGDGAA